MSYMETEEMEFSIAEQDTPMVCWFDDGGIFALMSLTLSIKK